MSSRHPEHTVSDSRQSPPSPTELLELAEHAALAKIASPPARTLGLAGSAGLAIALGFAFFVTVTTGTETAPWGPGRLLGGMVFSLGLVLILVCGGELFTSSILACIPWATRRLDTQRLLRNWILVYVGNLVGALALAALLLIARTHELAAGRWGLNVLDIAQHKLQHSFASAVALGLLCNLMVCLAVWLSYSARRSAEKTLLIVLPVALFVSSGFEHVVANMFIVPLALGILHSADASFWQHAGHGPAHYAGVDATRFVLHSLLPVTLGNILGGLLVGLGQQALHGKTHTPAPAARARAQAGVWIR